MCCAQFFLLCVLCKPIIMLTTFTIFLLFLRTNSTSPPTHFTRAPPPHAKNCYLNGRLMILHASELATELFDEVQSPRCTFAISIATAKLPCTSDTSWSRAWYYHRLLYLRHGIGNMKISPDHARFAKKRARIVCTQPV